MIALVESERKEEGGGNMSKGVLRDVEELMSGSVEFKHSKDHLRKKIERVAERSPEVMVKVTGHTKGVKHMLSHLDYISRNGKVELETERGDILKSKEEVRKLHSEWAKNNGKRTKNTRETSNIILSMPEETNPKKVKEAVREFAKKTFSENYQYVFALHEDTKNPHVHLTIKTLGFDRKRLQIKKGDPQKWREGFARELRYLGVEAEATGRAARGVILKGIPQVIKHIRERGFTPKTDEKRVKEMLEEIRKEQQGKALNKKDWEVSIAEKQSAVRKAWIGAAKSLAKTGREEDYKLAKSIVSFVEKMPVIKTANHLIKEKLVKQIEQNRGLSKGIDR